MSDEESFSRFSLFLTTCKWGIVILWYQMLNVFIDVEVERYVIKAVKVIVRVWVIGQSIEKLVGYLIIASIWKEVSRSEMLLYS